MAFTSSGSCTAIMSLFQTKLWQGGERRAGQRRARAGRRQCCRRAVQRTRRLRSGMAVTYNR